MTVNQYRNVIRIITTALVAYQGLYYAIVQPSRMDTFNGLMGGLIIYCIWVARNDK